MRDAEHSTEVPAGPVDDRDDVDWRTPEAQREAQAYWAWNMAACGGDPSPDPLGGRAIPRWYYAYL